MGPLCSTPILGVIVLHGTNILLKKNSTRSGPVQPIALTIHWDRTVLVLRDSGGIPLSHLLGQAEDVCPLVQQAGSAALAEASNGELIFRYLRYNLFFCFM